MDNKISKGLVLAGLFNIAGVLTLTKGFQDFSVGDYFPELFSAWGLGGVFLWGLAYLGLSTSYRAAPALLLVFALEKFFYFGSWAWWQFHNFTKLPDIWSENPLAAVFYSGYGAFDFAFGVFFLSLFFGVKKES